MHCPGDDGALPAIAGYDLERLVGIGGMGRVYRARQLSLGQPVAVKLLSETLRGRSWFVDQFEREARHQANLQHPHVLPVIDRGSTNGLPYLVMRYVDGYSLRELIRCDALGAMQVVELLTGVASALDYAHARDVLHLDVKPQNVLVEGERHAWLADFGLTCRRGAGPRPGGHGEMLGSLDYLAPEIAHGQPPSPACDVYSLAVTAFHAVTGALPFPAASQAQDVLVGAKRVRPKASDYRPGLPSRLDDVLRRAMAADPAMRHPSAGSLADDLRAAVGLRRLGVPHLDAVAFTDGHEPAEMPTWAPTLGAHIAVGAAVAR